MAKAEATVEELVGMIERGELRLPEMQRRYVWRSTRARDLLDSLYRGYPSGAILLWETDETVPLQEFAVEQEGNPYQSTRLLLDGQQRLTSLAAVIRGQPVWRAKAQAAQGREKRQLEKKIEEAEDLLQDLEAQDERGREVGWAHEIDDGVILNLASLRELMPAWSKEPAKHWAEFQAAEHDWSRTAMRYWPDRVLARCRTNKSYAIAHGRLDLHEGGGS